MFNFMVKYKGPGERWQDISEAQAFDILLNDYPRIEIPDQIFKIKCGHHIETEKAIIEAWPKDREI